MVFVNARAFSRLPAEVQDAVLEAAAAAEARGWEMAIAETDAKTAELAENGITVYDPNADLTDTLGSVGQTMTNEWFEEMGYDSDNPIADIVGQ